MPSSRVSTDTLLHFVSSFDHLVTQWMSTVISSCGSAWNCSHVQLRGWSISPSMVSIQRSSGMRGVGPAESTGKSLTTCWPGGTRAALTSVRRLPLNPREMKAMATSLVGGSLADSSDSTHKEGAEDEPDHS